MSGVENYLMNRFLGQHGTNIKTPLPNIKVAGMIGAPTTSKAGAVSTAQKAPNTADRGKGDIDDFDDSMKIMEMPGKGTTGKFIPGKGTIYNPNWNPVNYIPGKGTIYNGPNWTPNAAEAAVEPSANMERPQPPWVFENDKSAYFHPQLQMYYDQDENDIYESIDYLQIQEPIEDKETFERLMGARGFENAERFGINLLPYKFVHGSKWTSEWGYGTTFNLPTYDMSGNVKKHEKKIKPDLEARDLETDANGKVLNRGKRNWKVFSQANKEQHLDKNGNILDMGDDGILRPKIEGGRGVTSKYIMDSRNAQLKKDGSKNDYLQNDVIAEEMNRIRDQKRKAELALDPEVKKQIEAAEKEELAEFNRGYMNKAMIPDEWTTYDELYPEVGSEAVVFSWMHAYLEADRKLPFLYSKISRVLYQLPRDNSNGKDIPLRLQGTDEFRVLEENELEKVEKETDKEDSTLTSSALEKVMKRDHTVYQILGSLVLEPTVVNRAVLKNMIKAQQCLMEKPEREEIEGARKTKGGGDYSEFVKELWETDESTLYRKKKKDKDVDYLDEEKDQQELDLASLPECHVRRLARVIMHACRRKNENDSEIVYATFFEASGQPLPDYLEDSILAQFNFDKSEKNAMKRWRIAEDVKLEVNVGSGDVNLNDLLSSHANKKKQQSRQMMQGEVIKANILDKDVKNAQHYFKCFAISPEDKDSSAVKVQSYGPTEVAASSKQQSIISALPQSATEDTDVPLLKMQRIWLNKNKYGARGEDANKM